MITLKIFAIGFGTGFTVAVIMYFIMQCLIRLNLGKTLWEKWRGYTIKDYLSAEAKMAKGKPGELVPMTKCEIKL